MHAKLISLNSTYRRVVSIMPFNGVMWSCCSPSKTPQHAKADTILPASRSRCDLFAARSLHGEDVVGPG